VFWDCGRNRAYLSLRVAVTLNKRFVSINSVTEVARLQRGDEIRRNISLKFEPKFIDNIDERAEDLGVTRTMFIENILMNSMIANNNGQSTRSQPVIDESVEQDDNPNSEDDSSSLTNGEQEIFDIAWDGGRAEKEGEQSMQELTNISRGVISNETNFQRLRKEYHIHVFKPWLEKCNGGDNCVEVNQEFPEGVNLEDYLYCDTFFCTGSLSVKEALQRPGVSCPVCDKSLMTQIKEMVGIKDESQSEQEDESE